MIKLGKRYITIWCLAASAFLYLDHTHADSYLCEAEQASGFVYDLKKQNWEASTFSMVGTKYLIAPADTDNVFIKALSYDYEVKQLDSAQPIIHCKAVKLIDSNEETGLVSCNGPEGASFTFDKRSGRFIHSQPAGYITLKTGAKTENGPFMEIGKCSPK